MITLDERALEMHVRSAVGQLVDGADKLRSLADLLEELGSTQGNAEPVDLRRAVVGIQSAAMQALFTARGRWHSERRDAGAVHGVRGGWIGRPHSSYRGAQGGGRCLRNAAKADARAPAAN